MRVLLVGWHRIGQPYANADLELKWAMPPAGSHHAQEIDHPATVGASFV
jgi:hypothetical protein